MSRWLRHVVQMRILESLCKSACYREAKEAFETLEPQETAAYNMCPSGVCVGTCFRGWALA